MRLHRLEVTAFGPFADTVVVDFDLLSDAGLFLLTGATGAGKTSVLDAVCFALYGDVPGDRGSAKRLRSDQALPGATPRVTLEATLSGRRFRIVRSPAFERLKRRGTGTTPQQASVTFSERLSGEWVPLSSRLEETGHLVTRLVGMNLSQFTQVAMLPQGRFQAFLRARSDERHQLLQKLFRTGRFEDVEKWLRERRLDLRRKSEADQQRVADLVSRVSEATEAGLPADWDIRELEEPAADGSLLAWSVALCDSAEQSRGAAQDLSSTAATAESAARLSLEAGRSLAQLRERHDAAATERALLLSAADLHQSELLALDDARRAAAVAPLQRLVTAGSVTRVGAAQSASTALARAATVFERVAPMQVDRDFLTEAVSLAVDDAARIRAALPQELRLAAASTELELAEHQQSELTTHITRVTQQRQLLPERIVVLKSQLEAARAASLGVGAAQGRVGEVRARLDALAQVESLTRELSGAQTALQAVSLAAQLRREAWLDLREARIEGMAAEIAGVLAIGACCPVCGSAEHPHLASTAPGAPDAAAEKAALKHLDDAKATEHLHDEQVRDLTTRLAVAVANAGGSTADVLTAELARHESDLAALESLAARADSVERALSAVEAQREELVGELQLLVARDGRLASTLQGLRTEIAALSSEIESLLRGTGLGDLSSLIDAHLRRVATGRTALSALDDLEAAEGAFAEAEQALADASAEAGFDSPTEATSAILDTRDLDELAERVARHQHRLAAVSEVLSEPGSDQLADTEPPDLGALAAAHVAALAALGDAHSVTSLWSGRVSRLTSLRGDLEEALADWAPLRADLELTTRLSSFVEGKSLDNRLQMRLSAYVLAYRLSQVVAAANERLARMSDQRYSLEHTAQRGAGETRGGLSLLVRDDWSGESRDPATLSGGETFVVSLALALGLSDVITQEAGGADLDTLFVDEGFGSLDSDTLDDVMDTLDSLRDGGRVVGVVSHVAEMRDRIPTQLLVTKSRGGSTVSISG